MPGGLIGALALILGVEWYIASHKAVTLDASLWCYEQARGMASKGVKDCDVLAFGDSLTKHGVAPKVIQEVTGLKGYNLALSGSHVPVSYFLFREAIMSGARPKVVLLDLFPTLLTADHWSQSGVTLWPIVVSYRDCLELGWLTGDAKFFASLMIRKMLPSVRCREAIRAEIPTALRGLAGVNWTGCQVAFRHWEVNRGYEIANNRHDPNNPLENQVAHYFQPIRCTSLNRFYIDQFMKLADEHDVKVFLMLPPYMPIMQAKLEQVGFDADHEGFVRSMLDRYPALSVLDARKANYEPSALIDTHHLAYEGATTFSTEIGELLRRKLADTGSTDRWIALPPFSKRAIAVKHESLEESRLVVLQEIQKRRR
jgi:hypothetical protein